MKQIWKFPLPVTDAAMVPMPHGAKVLCVQSQGDQVCLWAIVDQIKEVPVVTDAQVKRVESVTGRIEAEGAKRIEAAEKLAASGRELIETARQFAAALGKATTPPATHTNPPSGPRAASAPPRIPIANIAAPRSVPLPRQPRVAATGEPNPSLPKAEKKILNALANYPHGKTKIQVAVLSGYAHSGGGFNNSLSALRSKAAIVDNNDLLQITDAGMELLGDFTPLPTGQGLLDHWRGQLAKAEREILDVLVAAYPNALTKEDVAAQTESQYAADGGGFNNAISRLRTLELVGGKREIKAADMLFETGSGVKELILLVIFPRRIYTDS